MRFVPPLLVLVAVACSPAPREDVVPPDPPTQQTFTSSGVGAVTLTWRNPKDADFDGTLLARLAKPAGVKPAAKSTPMAGEAFGDGKVLYLGNASTFLDSDAPTGCDPFAYQLWSRDRAGNWSAGPAQIDLAPGASSQTPLVAPTALTAAAIDGDVQLAWTNPPANSGYAELRVVRKQGPVAPSTSTDGVAIYRGPDATTAEPLQGLAAGTWSYGVFACNACGLCHPTPASVRFTRSTGEDGGTADGGMEPVDGGVPGPLTPTDLAVQLSGDGKNVLLSWNTPADVTAVKVLRTVNSSALGPGDSTAVLVFQGPGSNASERTEKLVVHTVAAPQVFHYRVYGCKNASCETVGAAKTLSLTLQQGLKGGGYTLFWRHATANVCLDQTQLGPASSTTQPNWWRSCDKNCSSAFARQLDGVNAPNETSTIHAQFAAKGFTVGKVLSSEFCRAVETAQGLDFGPPIELSQALTYYVYDEAQRCVNTMALLNTPPAAGTNTAMVSHAGFTCATIDALAWGEAAVYRPVPGGAARFIARVPWNGWSLLP